jgi:hypothetical protein
MVLEGLTRRRADICPRVLTSLVPSFCDSAAASMVLA